MINKRLAAAAAGSLLLVIALSASVISASTESTAQLQQQPDSSAPHLKESADQRQPESSAPVLEAKKSDPQPVAPPAKQAEESGPASKQAPAAEPATESAMNGKRKAKSADPEIPAAAASGSASADQKPAADEKAAAGEKGEQAAKAKAAEPPAASKSSAGPSKATQQKQSSLSGKSGSSKSKLPANLGTVTSTGSGGATHYMSKHDAYSAIAEKHGALAHDAMRKSDKRHMHSSGGGNPFSGSIQKASGLGEMLNPFKGVTDSGLARTLGASMRSIMKSKYSVPAYVASALLGAVALMAFYESPISPLPVPALPNPPVGRFPPEMPNISPGLQVPFRTNQQQQQQQYGQQQNYNQRSLLGAGQQQQQQVFFPGNGPQQRQMTSSGSPVQNLAANLLATVAKPQQNAQRKSGIDYDPSTSRSLFGNNSPFAAPQKASVGSPTNQQQRQSSAFLSFFGLGGDQHSGASASSHIEPKGGPQAAAQAGALSNSHIVNKVKSYFRAPSPSGSSSAAGISNSNPYDQYQRMSFVQALMKDTAFLPAFLTPGNRKSSSPAAASSAASASKPSSAADSTAATNPSGGAAANQQVAASRMQVGNEGQLPKQQQQQQQQQGKQASYGIVKVAHALLESFGSGIAQRSSQSSERKPNSDENQSIAAATSLLSDLVSGYAANQVDHQQQQQPQHQQPQQQSPQNQQASSAPQPAAQQQQQQQQPQPQSQAQAQQPQGEIPQLQARSDDDEPTIITADDQFFTSKKTDEKQPLVRKTRSIGLEYPVNEVAQFEQQQPSRAAQINNVIDFVADSYAHNKMLFNFVMNQVGLSQAVPYVEQLLDPTTGKDSQ